MDFPGRPILYNCPQVPQPQALHGHRGAAAMRAVVARVPRRGADDREHHDQDGRDGAQTLSRQQMVSRLGLLCDL